MKKFNNSNFDSVISFLILAPFWLIPLTGMIFLALISIFAGGRARNAWEAASKNDTLFSVTSWILGSLFYIGIGLMIWAYFNP